MNTNTRKSFWMVEEGGKVLPAHQDTEFNGIDNVLVFARSAIEALVIAEAYANDAIGVNNVVADDGEVVAAASAQSEDMLSEWIANYGKSLLATNLLELVAEKGCIEVAWGIYLHSGEHLLSKYPQKKCFAGAKFWITSYFSDYIRPLSDDAEDPLLIETISSVGEGKIAKVIEAHLTA